MTTPMMLQWQSCKAKSPSGILLFRLGDFYEAFYEDAKLLSKVLDLTLTKRQDVPMAGIPSHTCETYIDRLVGKGYRVAIAEQIGDPKTHKGLLPREIVRVITPGSLINSSLLIDKESNYLASLIKKENHFGLALVDISTGQLKACLYEKEKELLDALGRFRPKELIAPEAWKNDRVLSEIEELIRPSVVFVAESGVYEKNLCDAAIAILFRYIKELNLPTEHIQTAEPTTEFMQIDRATQRNLELLLPLHEGQKESTLLYLLDETKTAMGGRLLRDWLSHPLASIARIRERQEVVALFFAEFGSLLKLRQHLAEVYDLERLIMRIQTGFASPKDLVMLRDSLKAIPPLVEKLHSLTKPPLLERLISDLSDTSSLTTLLDKAMSDTPPLRISDGGVFKQGYHQELDALLALKSSQVEWVANYQIRLREETAIKTLKVGYTDAFGYFIEVSRGTPPEKIPYHFQRKQTLTNTERYTTAELKEFEGEILTATDRILTLETRLFKELCQTLSAAQNQVRAIASACAGLDSLLSLAIVAKENGYICPLLHNGPDFSVQGARHPVIEKRLSQPFIANAIELSSSQQLALITGPNMAGKSTFIRQAALLAILAHIGSFVPAHSASIPLIDKLFCRIGASDDLSKGLSTFMVEMIETAYILENATSRSLVILDEIGRGTSTYDGISIAWAVAQYLLTTPGKQAKTLFATHYSELTELPSTFRAAFNLHVKVHESEEGIIFLHTVVPGAASKSYGIHVARLAGLPEEALKRAEEKLKELEQIGAF
jgi:DNA mismatch repair protein MutS